MVHIKNAMDLHNNPALANLKSLDELASSSRRPREINRWIEIERQIIEKGLAPSLTAYILTSYHLEGKNRTDVASALGVSYDTIDTIMEKLGIPKRTMSESVRIAKKIDAPERGTPAYYAVIDKLVDDIKTKNKRLENRNPSNQTNLSTMKRQNLSTTIIAQSAGYSFEGIYGKTPRARQALLNEIVARHPEMAGILELVDVHRRRTSSRHNWSDDENKIIENLIITFLEQKGYAELPKILPRDTAKYVREELIKKGINCGTPQAVRCAMSRLYRTDTEREIKGSPHSKQLTDLIKTAIEELDKKPAAKTLEGIVEPDDDKAKIHKFLHNTPYWHQALVLYMMDETNYKKVLGDDAELVKADFDETKTSQELVKKYQTMMRKMALSPHQEDKEVIDFVNGWLRCDLIYKNKSTGRYMISEVKQYALNREIPEEKRNTHNADKARQQLAAYCAVLQDNIRYRNLQHPSNGEPHLPETVEGYLIAYEIDPKLADHLRTTPAGVRGAIKIDKKDVRAYLGRQTNVKKSTPQTESEESQTAWALAK